MSRAAVATVWLLALPGVASACPVCFGASDGPMLRGSNIGIFVLLIVTLVMLAAFGAFFATLARRAARAAADDLSSPDWNGSQAQGGTAR